MEKLKDRYCRNLKKVLEIMNLSKLDAIIVSDCYNMRYISGFTGGTGYLLILKEKKYLLTDFRYIFQAQNQAEPNGFEIMELKKCGYFKMINDLMHINDCKVVAFENKSISYMDYVELSENIIGIKLEEMDEKLLELRYIKDELEIEKLGEAERIGDMAFKKILDDIKPGMTEKEIAAKLEYYMKMAGADGLSFETIVASGVNSSMPHAGVSNKKVENGDFVTMDFGCIYEGYCSDMTRTIVLGKASKEQKKIYETVLNAQLEAMKYIKAGVYGKDIDTIARNIINEAGYEGCFGHGLGHSVGLVIHENPRFSQSETKKVNEGTVITVEPGIYIKNFGGVRIEDMVVVTNDGYINLTSSTKELIEL